MPQAYQPKVVPLGNKGVVLKLDPSPLQDGQYQNLKNMVSLQEGAIVTRNGYQRVNSSPFTNPQGVTIGLIHTLSRLATQQNASASGTVNVSGTTVTWVSGNVFDTTWPAGTQITINSVTYTILVVNFATQLQLVENAGSQTGAAYSVNFQQSGYRYLGTDGGSIYRIPQIVNPPFYMSVAEILTSHKWNGVSYRKFTSGEPYQYFATPNFMLKDPLTDTPSGVLGNLQHWGLNRPVYNASAGLAGLGTLKGPNPYKWVFTFRNPITGHEGNPSPLTLGTGLVVDTANGSSANVFINPTHPAPPQSVNQINYIDPQASAADSIAIYRAGGAFFDGLYRFVGYTQPIPLPASTGTVNTTGTRVDLVAGSSFSASWVGQSITIGGVPVGVAQVVSPSLLYTNTQPFQGSGLAYSKAEVDTGLITFVDNVPDSVIASARTVEFDNDPPVTASLPIPLIATIASYASGGGAAGINVVNLTIQQGLPFGETDLSAVLRPGSRVQVGTGANSELCTVWAISGSLQVRLYFQNTHVVGEMVTTASVANEPCSLVALAYNSLFVAGDANNPSMLYKSKPSHPESFPVVNLADGSSGSMEVGSPSNPIMAICEFNGELVSLNKSNIYLVRLWNGAMQTPIQTPAQRGLFGKNAWSKADNEIWYVSYDGVYSWSGGASVKRSEAIDSVFKGEFINGFVPISLSTAPDANGISDLDRVELHYSQNEILLIYRDTTGQTRRLRYHTIYDRWSQDENDAQNVPTTMFLEDDTGLFLMATTNQAGTTARINIDNTPITNAIAATTDGWTAADHNNGVAIPWEAKTAFFTMGAPSVNKQWGDVLLELQNPLDGDPTHTVTVQTFYDFSATADATDVFTITQGAGRRRVVLPLNSGNGREAYAVAFRFSGSTQVPVTLYTLTFNWFALEQIQLGRAFDWDNLGHPHDKKLTHVSVEYDVGGANVTLNMDTMAGILGNTEQQARQLFTLNSPASSLSTGPLRSRTTFAIADDTVVKLVRLRPSVPASVFKFWDYKFDFWPYPADTILFTEWEDLGYPCDKLFREILLNTDTNDVDCRVDMQLDGVTRQTFTIRTTTRDRRRVLTCASEVIGKNVRLVFTPGIGGKNQLFEYKYNWIPEPCCVLHWDSYEQAFGADTFKFIKQMWAEYVCDSAITVTVIRDNNQIFYQKQLPRHEFRNVERFYLPPKSTAGYLNKSKIYRFQIDPCNPCACFKLYRDTTRVEWMALSGDMRQPYQQSHLWEPIPIPIQ